MKKGTVLITIGISVILASACFAGYNIYTADKAYQDAVNVLDRLENMIPVIDQSASADNNIHENNAQNGENTDVSLENDGNFNTPVTGESAIPAETEAPVHIAEPEIEMPVQVIDGKKYTGILEIPGISLKLPVIDQMSDAGLNSSPCRYSGSAYSDDMIIGAHDYKRFFAPIRNLSAGTDVKFTDVDGNVFLYKVISKESVRGDSPSELEEGDWDMSLFTCAVNSNYRVVLRCARIS